MRKLLIVLISFLLIFTMSCSNDTPPVTDGETGTDQGGETPDTPDLEPGEHLEHFVMPEADREMSSEALAVYLPFFEAVEDVSLSDTVVNWTVGRSGYRQIFNNGGVLLGDVFIRSVDGVYTTTVTLSVGYGDFEAGDVFEEKILNDTATYTWNGEESDAATFGAVSEFLSDVEGSSMYLVRGVFEKEGLVVGDETCSFTVSYEKVDESDLGINASSSNTEESARIEVTFTDPPAGISSFVLYTSDVVTETENTLEVCRLEDTYSVFNLDDSGDTLKGFVSNVVRDPS